MGKSFQTGCAAFAMCACAARQPLAPAPPPAPVSVSTASPAGRPSRPAPVAQALSSAPITATFVAVGEITAPTNGVIQAPGTSVGVVHKIDVDPIFLASGQTTIAVQLGTQFGVEVLVEGAPHGQVVGLHTRVTHPPIKSPSATAATTVDEWFSPMNADIPRHTGWSFDNPWEIVPGHWQIEILYQGETLASQGFEITRL